METIKLTVNGQPREVTVDPGTPLLWLLREELKMTGTKYGCGISVCGACTVHLGGVATRSCVVPISLVGDRPIVTSNVFEYPLVKGTAVAVVADKFWIAKQARD